MFQIKHPEIYNGLNAYNQNLKFFGHLGQNYTPMMHSSYLMILKLRQASEISLIEMTQNFIAGEEKLAAGGKYNILHHMAPYLEAAGVATGQKLTPTQLAKGLNP